MFTGLASGISSDNKALINKFLSRFGFAAMDNGSDTENALELTLHGGRDSMFRASKNAEDDPQRCVVDLQAHDFCGKDILVGISTSGSAAYVIGAIEYAKSLGATTVSITNNPGTALAAAADIDICADTGPEVITGSTRMKAGTAQKIILNMISTIAMVKCGHVYENLMINLKPTNKKLRRRMIGIVVDILHCTEEKAEKLLDENNWSIRAVVDKEDK